MSDFCESSLSVYWCCILFMSLVKTGVGTSECEGDRCEQVCEQCPSFQRSPRDINICIRKHPWPQLLSVIFSLTCNFFGSVFFIMAEYLVDSRPRSHLISNIWDHLVLIKHLLPLRLHFNNHIAANISVSLEYIITFCPMSAIWNIFNSVQNSLWEIRLTFNDEP